MDGERLRLPATIHAKDQTMAHGQRESFVIITTDSEDGSMSRQYASLAGVIRHAEEHWNPGLLHFVVTYLPHKLRSMDVGDMIDGYAHGRGDAKKWRFYDRIVMVGP